MRFPGSARRAPRPSSRAVPDARKDDLVRKKIIPANVYKDIKDRIVADAER